MGAAVLLIITVYVSAPFRRIKVDVDRTIEKWVSAARNQLDSGDALSGVETSSVYPEVKVDMGKVDSLEPVNFCPHCGRRVEVDHRFCPGCGTLLLKEQ